MSKEDAYKGNQHVPYQNDGDVDDAITTPNEPIFVPKGKDGELKNVLTDEDGKK